MSYKTKLLLTQNNGDWRRRSAHIFKAASTLPFGEFAHECARRVYPEERITDSADIKLFDIENGLIQIVDEPDTPLCELRESGDIYRHCQILVVLASRQAIENPSAAQRAELAQQQELSRCLQSQSQSLSAPSSSHSCSQSVGYPSSSHALSSLRCDALELAHNDDEDEDELVCTLRDEDQHEQQEEQSQGRKRSTREFEASEATDRPSKRRKAEQEQAQAQEASPNRSRKKKKKKKKKKHKRRAAEVDPYAQPVVHAEEATPSLSTGSNVQRQKNDASGVGADNGKEPPKKKARSLELE